MSKGGLGKAAAAAAAVCLVVVAGTFAKGCSQSCRCPFTAQSLGRICREEKRRIR